MESTRRTERAQEPPRGRRRWLTAALACAAGLVACSETMGPLEQLPRSLTPAEEAVLSASNEFGIELYRRLAADARDENVFFSPLSAHTALGMTANGAVGETLDGMRAALAQEGLTEEEANAAYRDLSDLLLGLDRSVELEIANSIWYRMGLAVRPEFVDLARAIFDADVRDLDFDDPQAPDVINQWVEEETRGRITDLIEEIRREHVMFLVNAVYFKGDWTRAFDPDDTRDGAFARLDGGTVQVPMMRRSDASDVRVFDGDGLTGIEIPYGRGAFVMTILLPPAGTHPADLLASADADAWDAWMAGLAPAGEVAVELPRFRLEWEEYLNDALIDMGMAVAFDRDLADFDRIAAGGADFYISFVRQKAFVDVNEEGTEAAAATSVGIGVVSAPPTFRVDRPFLFAIRERFSGAVLFMGQVLDPTAG